MTAPFGQDPLGGIDEQQRLDLLLKVAAQRRLTLPPEVLLQQRHIEAASRGLCLYDNFGQFVADRKSELLEHDYMQRQVAVANEVAEHRKNRVIVIIPTQYGKSEVWSRLLPAYYLLKYPARRVALSSYGADLAWELSGEARDYYGLAGGRFKEGSPKGSTRNWKTQRYGGMPGGMWATGVGGPALGRGYNLGIVDDPIDPEKVLSGTWQRKFARWWPSKWLRGQRPGGAAIVVVMQRLDVADPVSWLLEREFGETAERWHIVVMDEIRSNEPFGRWTGPLGFPPTCTVEPDPRPIGRVLAPKFRDEAEVKHLQATAGPVVAAAQRQQRPMRPTGDFWRQDWFKDREYETLPADAYNGGWDWDTAYTKDEQNSATAGVKTFRGPGKMDECRIYVEDVYWDWLEFPELVAELRKKAGPHYVEKKASGKSVVQALKAYQVSAAEVLVSGDKLARSSAAQPVVSAQRVYVNKLVVQKLLFGEHQGLLRVTAEALQGEGEGLDLNDAFVQSLHRHLEIGVTKKRRAAFG